jgi:hypothetical protein
MKLIQQTNFLGASNCHLHGACLVLRETVNFTEMSESAAVRLRSILRDTNTQHTHTASFLTETHQCTLTVHQKA